MSNNVSTKSKSKERNVRKLVSYPQRVWKDVSIHVMDKFGLKTPYHHFDVVKFTNSKSFSYKEFVRDISQNKAALLLTLICKKLKISFIRDSKGWHVLSLNKNLDSILNFVSTSKITLEDKSVPVINSKSVSQ